jgi:hypothetical protein
MLMEFIIQQREEFDLFGVPTDYQSTIDDYTKTIKNNIKNNVDGFIQLINEEFKSEKTLNLIYLIIINYMLMRKLQRLIIKLI